jgi:hypothetical protein
MTANDWPCRNHQGKTCPGDGCPRSQGCAIDRGFTLDRPLPRGVLAWLLFSAGVAYSGVVIIVELIAAAVVPQLVRSVRWVERHSRLILLFVAAAVATFILVVSLL